MSETAIVGATLSCYHVLTRVQLLQHCRGPALRCAPRAPVENLPALREMGAIQVAMEEGTRNALKDTCACVLFCRLAMYSGVGGSSGGLFSFCRKNPIRNDKSCQERWLVQEEGDSHFPRGVAVRTPAFQNFWRRGLTREGLSFTVIS